jgi:hypothetical protein
VSKKLIVSDGMRERELQLVGRIVVGRDPACDVSHDHSLLSRRHAEFVAAGDLVVVRDLGSRNGVFVNGTKTAEHSLQPGDVVQIGPLRAEYVLDRVPLSIAPEDHDAERTAVIHGLTPQAAAPPPAAVPDPLDDEEATRLITARRPETESLPEAVPPERPAMAPDADDDETRYIRAPRSPAAAPEAGQTVSAVTRPAAPHSLRTFVFLRLLVLGGLVLGTAVISLRVDGTAAPLSTLVVPVIVAVVAGYLVSGVIDRRFMQTAGGRGTD